jgi:BirA family biotin operon repressor/biotin-[acetyl-CoA-carboxylase] ligase
LEPFIKLPNDLWLNGKKVAGILTENIVGKDVKLSVMGIGLNTNIEKFPKDLENIATSLKIELAKKVDNEKILKEIIKGLKEQLAIISD